MTAIRRTAYAFILVALVTSGAYVFIYLYRWEWNRALIAGVIFIAAEIGLIGAAVLSRIRTLEAKLDAQLQSGAAVSERAPGDDDLSPSSPFAWLSDAGEGMGVFVPVLMGVGLLISALAWAVERIAAATARPIVNRRLAAKLAPLSIHPEAARRPRPMHTAFQGIAVVAILVLAAAGLGRLADATQNRPDEVAPGTTSEVVLEVYLRDPKASGAVAAQSLWGACQGTVSRALVGGRAERLTPDRFRLVLSPALGHHDERRLHGCIEDALLDGIQARVVSATIAAQ